MKGFAKKLFVVVYVFFYYFFGTPGTYLRYPHGASQARLDLPQVHDSRDPHDLQHAVPVVGLAELIVLLRAPRVRARTPAVGRMRLVVVVKRSMLWSGLYAKVFLIRSQ